MEAQITTKAEQFLKVWGQGDFVQKDCKWKSILEWKEEFDTVTFSSQYGLLLKYAKTYQGVPTTGNVQTLMGEPASSGQYIEFLYISDGTLLEVKAIGKEEEKAAGDSFTLAGGDSTSNGGTAVLKPTENSEETKNHVYVDTIMLEYRYEQDENQRSAEVRLVPVWSFYGRQRAELGNASTLISSRNPVSVDQEGLLVSINAEDGTIYGK